MSTDPAGVLIVGAGAAALSTAEALRRKGFAGRLTMVGGEAHLPYDRPPLSKQVLAGTWEPGKTQLRSAEMLSVLDAELVLGDPAVGLDIATRTVSTACGRALRADAVVIGTGVSARTFPGQHSLSGVHVLRTLDDALALRAALSAASRLVVVGDGVLGAEIAATARGMGAEVTLAGPQPALMADQLGPLVGGMLGELHTEHGVVLRLGAGVRELRGSNGRVTGVCLSTGEVLPADVVVIAIGGVPATGWLAESGLRLDNGLVCDSRCRAARGIYAVGDVARWHHEQLDTLLRLENRTNATEQAGVVAANILGADEPYRPIPYFWTDQFGVKVQVHGSVAPDAEASIVEGDLTARRFVARFQLDGRTTGVLGWNMPKQTRQHREAISDGLRAVTPTG